jgi:superfamily I DNA/RNA helicase
VFVPKIEALPDAIDGVVDRIPQLELPNLIHTGDLVLCRTNAPLVTVALDLLLRGFNVKISNTDILSEVISYIRDISKDSKTLDERMVLNYEFAEDARIRAKSKFYLLEAFKDAMQILKVIAKMKGQDSADSYVHVVNSLFSPDALKEAIMFSTIHGQKGLEADNVFIIETPQRDDLLEWEQVQERNLQYVAVTRAKKNLFYIMPE